MVVHLIDAEGVNRQVLLLSSALRPAVINFVLTEKYARIWTCIVDRCFQHSSFFPIDPAPVLDDPLIREFS